MRSRLLIPSAPVTGAGISPATSPTFTINCAALMFQFSSSCSITRLTATKLPTNARLAASRRTGNQSKA
ncbi:hypothetical protein D9M71_730500 [compost metagenome]